jgi:hypothetical protein
MLGTWIGVWTPRADLERCPSWPEKSLFMLPHAFCSLLCALALVGCLGEPVVQKALQLSGAIDQLPYKRFNWRSLVGASARLPLADEPFVALDFLSRLRVHELLCELGETNRPAYASLAPRSTVPRISRALARFARRRLGLG